MHALGLTIQVHMMSEPNTSDLDIPVLTFHSHNLAEQHMDPRKVMCAMVAYQSPSPSKMPP